MAKNIVYCNGILSSHAYATIKTGDMHAHINYTDYITLPKIIFT